MQLTELAYQEKELLLKNIANQLNFDHLDTGLLYRYFAYLISEKKIDEKNTQELRQKFDFDEIKKVDLRTEKITKLASVIASKKIVRDFLIDIQKETLQIIHHLALVQ